MVKKRKFLILIVVSVILISLFGGVYEDDEFNERFFFIKSSPTLKWYFYSPRGMSDLKISEMTEEQQYNQIMYDKYVPSRLLSFPF